MRTFCFLLTIILFTSCAKSKYDSEHFQFRYDGQNRSYLLHLPNGYVESTSYPLIIALHGGTGTAKNIEEQSGLAVFSDEKGFILCSPNGYKRTWNVGRCCGKARQDEIDDVGFINKLLDELEANYNINPSQIYATGMSNGAMMSYRLACELSHRIAAIAPVAGGMAALNCVAQNPVSVIHFHSYEDSNVPWNGGIGDGLSDHYNPPLDSIAEAWAVLNECSTDSTFTTGDGVDVWNWSNCADSSEIVFYLTKDGGHSWSMGIAPRRRADQPSEVINANELMWDFFKTHPKQ